MPVSLSTLVLDPASPLRWFLDVLHRVPSLALLLVFGIIAAAGPRPLADYTVLAFAALTLVNILVRPVSSATIGPAVAAAIAFATLNSHIVTVKLKQRLKRLLGWTRNQLEARIGPPGPPRR